MYYNIKYISVFILSLFHFFGNAQEITILLAGAPISACNQIWETQKVKLKVRSPSSCTVNTLDRILWQTYNGTFNLYHETDYNLDGDINGMNKINWSQNNGFFNNVPR